MTKPKGLGRGLDALLGGPPASTPTPRFTPAHPDEVQDFPSGKSRAGVMEVAIADIERNPDQPRATFDEGKLAELAASIRTYGIIQPLTLRKVRASKYQLVAGERRFRAAQQAGLSSVPAYVREANDSELLEVALVENLQREDLDPLEVATSFQRLLDECGLTHESLATRIGQGRSSITNHLRLLSMHETVQAFLKSRELTLGHAKVLAGITGPDATVLQGALAEKTVQEGASIRTLQGWIRDGWPGQKRPTTPKEKSPLTDDEEQALDVVRLRLNGTRAKVSLKRTDGNAGQLTFHYTDAEVLEALLEKLGLR